MKTYHFPALVVAAAALVFLTCGTPALVSQSKVKQPAKLQKVPVGDTKKVFFEKDGDKRRVLVESTVCLRQGQLELLLTKKDGKTHESILAADIDARDLHLALLLAGAKAGRPVRFENDKIMPPAGSVIKVTLEYKDKDKGKIVRVPAQQWIRNSKTKKDLQIDWVFAGSVLFPDPDKKAPPFYGANSGGDIICVSNFETALMDLPIDSSRDNADLSFEAHTERIPAVDTPVLIILEPVAEKKTEKKK